jgi:glycine/D-amino acid oxidase-like deaminating enzyme
VRNPQSGGKAEEYGDDDRFDEGVERGHGRDQTQRPEQEHHPVLDAGVEIQRTDVDVKYGFRPYRSDGMRIEREGNVIHNYGHGGAGVSMSWWSALQAAQYIEEMPETVLQNVAEQLARSNVS